MVFITRIIVITVMTVMRMMTKPVMNTEQQQGLYSEVGARQGAEVS